MTGFGTILIVDDNATNRNLLVTLLQVAGYTTRTAHDGPTALLSVQADPPDLVLLDIRMPGMDGYQVAAILKADPAHAAIPVMMVSAEDDREARLAGLASGAEAFLTKPVDRTELYLRVRNLIRQKNHSDALMSHQAGLQEQIAARTSDLEQLVTHDALTGLPNRALFLERLGRAVDVSRGKNRSQAVLLVDLESHKDVNDTLGHTTGDLLLHQVAQRLRGCCREDDILGRLGGGEFVIAVGLDDVRAGAVALAEQICDVLRAPFHVTSHEIVLSPRIGISIAPRDATDAELLVLFAALAMQEAKGGSRSRHTFFEPQMNLDVQSRLALDGALRHAEGHQEFVLHYQPKVDLRTGRISGVEALLRWMRPGVGLVPPDAFIPALERSGLMVRVGSWVIGEAVRQLRCWMDAGITPLPVAVNVSARQFADGELGLHVIEALQCHGVPAGMLEIELTESMLMEDTDATVATLRQLKEHGVRICVDDFGTGYSSLAYLRSFPIDTLKIDKQFVQDITDADDAAMVLAIIRMAHDLNLCVVAEGIETRAQLDYLRECGCDQMQGFYFSRPLALAALESLISSGVDLAAELAVTRPTSLLEARRRGAS